MLHRDSVGGVSAENGHAPTAACKGMLAGKAGIMGRSDGVCR
jgi:hypothetical protein